MQRLILSTAFVLVLIAAVAAQEPQAQSGQKPQEPQAAQASQAQPSKSPAQLVNVRLDITLTDQREGASPATKTVTMLLADRELGRIRNIRDAYLNIDARPELLRDGRVKVMLTLEYRASANQDDKAALGTLSESVTAILEDGKPQMMSQSAEPMSDRRVKVELKATVLK